MRVRRSELLLICYFAYVLVVALFRPIALDVRLLIITLNLAIIGWLCLLTAGDRWGPGSMLSHVRDWFPTVLILLAYREMGWLVLPGQNGALEAQWIVWDRRLLYEWGFKAQVESLGPVLPVLFELAYLFVYAVPALAIGWLYLEKRRDRIDDFLSVQLLALLTAYAMYPWFPSEPPRTIFAGEDLPAYSGLLRRFNLMIVGGYGIHTSVFPSGHTAAAFGAALGLMRFLPERPWVGRRFWIYAVLIALATVYGRYHYAVDTLAGFAVALLAWALSWTWGSNLLRRA
jgi:membrane-associated phospholipid phosphatase